MSETSIVQALKAVADQEAQLSFRDFMQVALYHPQYGYYRKAKSRVGRHREADFYTAESIGPVFAKLVLAAADSILGGSLKDHHFVELGAEPDLSPFTQMAEKHCASYRALGPGEDLKLEGNCILFGNEVLDAQPFHRLIFQEGVWREYGVSLRDDTLRECLLQELSPPVLEARLPLPETMPEGYRLDLALEAEALPKKILNQPWQGLLLLLDYGRSWHELISARPSGTARAYFKHEATGDLLARPGEQDLTCHICWDRIEDVLRQHGLDSVLQRQEAFFVLNAEQAIAELIQKSPDSFDAERQSLMELLHPQHMGARFQALHALKSP